jgi:hypothetical protein
VREEGRGRASTPALGPQHPPVTDSPRTTAACPRAEERDAGRPCADRGRGGGRGRRRRRPSRERTCAEELHLASPVLRLGCVAGAQGASREKEGLGGEKLEEGGVKIFCVGHEGEI